MLMNKKRDLVRVIVFLVAGASLVVLGALNILYPALITEHASRGVTVAALGFVFVGMAIGMVEKWK
jgi:branched-subunit amino acid permease